VSDYTLRFLRYVVLFKATQIPSETVIVALVYRGSVISVIARGTSALHLFIVVFPETISGGVIIT
jgi:hypothetical protein